MKPPLQAASAGSIAAGGLADSGAPLEGGLRDQLARSFGRDFTPVRVHVGKQADRAARGLGALAYTVGNDIVFRDGAYDPLSEQGRALIAHEVAHVAQHGGRAYAPNFLRTDPTAVLPDADARLERQAHVASTAYQAGLPRGWAWERAARPFLGRAVTAGWSAPPGDYTVKYADDDRPVTEEQWLPDDPSIAKVQLGKFAVPRSKGPWAAHYKQVAEAGQLMAFVNVDSVNSSPSAALKQKRARTSELRNLWLLRVQWPQENANEWWEEAGGERIKGKEFKPRSRAGEVHIDHIVEMQLGGTNVPENLAPHDGKDNVESGRKIWQDVRAAALDVKEKIGGRAGGKKLKTVVLVWNDAAQSEAYDAGPDLPVLPKTNQESVLSSRRGQAATSARVHLTAVADLEAGSRPSDADRMKVAATQAALADYPITGGANTATLKVDPDKDKDAIENSPVPVNHAARELIPQIVLSDLRRPPGKKDHKVIGWFKSPKHPARAGGSIPLTIMDEKSQQLDFVVHEPNEKGRLEMKPATQKMKFIYPGLSEGTLNMRYTDDGLVGEGTLKPSVPLLRRTEMNVKLDSSGFSGELAADPKKLSLPPFKVTEAALTVTLAPQLAAGGHITFALGKIVDGRVEAGVDGAGLFARGDLVAHIPYLDQSKGHLEYRPSLGVVGFAEASASRAGGIVQSGRVRVDFDGRGWTPSGEILVGLPRSGTATLEVHKAGERVVFTGKARISVPGLKPVDTHLRYDGQHLSGTAKTTFELLGARGDIELRYDDGNFSGKGAVDLEKSRFKGRLDAELHRDGAWTGKGSGSLTIKPGLVGTIAIEYGRDKRLKTTGEMRFPTYTFLKPDGGSYTFFDKNIPDIPIFAISLGIGSVGLVAKVGASLTANYHFGPGEVRDMVISVTMYPLEDDLEAQLKASARIVLPAEMGIALKFRAGVSASVLIASATGYVTLTGGVKLVGGFDAKIDFSYAKGIVIFAADAQILAKLLLTLAIGAEIEIDAPLAGPWNWPFELASWTFDPGLQFGLVAPFRYQSDQELRLPSISSIKWIVPDIDVRALASSAASQVRKGIGV